MPSSVIDGTAGGVFADQPGSDRITFGANPATLTASQGQDTVLAGSGSLVIVSAGDANPVSIQGGAGDLIYSGGPGPATITGGSGTITLLPGNGPITLTADGRPVIIYAADAYNGYYELTPAASDTLSLSFNGATGEVDVLDHGNGRTLSVQQGYADFLDQPDDILNLTVPPVTVGGLLTGAEPTVVGAAPPNSTITLTNAAGDQLGPPVSADITGRWQAPAPMLPYGASLVVATASITAGGLPLNGTSPAEGSVDLLPPAPAVTGFTDGSGFQAGASGSTQDRLAEIDGTTQAGTTVQVFANGALLGDAAVAGGGTSWSFVPPANLPEGALAITAVATDAASGVASGASAPLALSVSLAPPSVAGFTDESGFMAGGTTLDHRPTLSGAAPGGASVEVYANGADLGAASVAGGAWSYAPSADLPDGVDSITAVATDTATGAASAASAPLVLTVEPAPPVLTDLAGASGDHANGDTVSDPSLVLSGTADPGTAVSVFDGANVLGQATVAGAAWSFDVPALADGPHSLTAASTDANADVSAASAAFAFTQAPPPPVLAGLTPATDTGASDVDGITSDADPTLVGTAVAGDLVTVYDGAAAIGAVVAAADGSWTLTPAAPFAYGPHPITATDAAADGSAVSLASAAETIQIVPPAPIIAMLDGTGAGQPLVRLTTSDVVPTISGTGLVGSVVSVHDGATLVGQSAAVGADGTWTVTAGSALARGTHTLTASSVDAAGDVSETSSAFALTVNPPPSAPPADADPFAFAIQSSIATLLNGQPIDYQGPGQPASNGGVAALSVDDGMSGQSVTVPGGTDYVSDIASGAVTVFGADGPRQAAVSTAGDLTYVAGSGSTSLLADQSSGSDVVFGSSDAASTLAAATGSGDDILLAGAGAASLSGGSGANQFWLGSGQAVVDSSGEDTVVAGSGAATVVAGASGGGIHSSLVFGGSGSLDLLNDGGNSTVASGAGSDTLLGGQGSVLFFGGHAGRNVLVAGAGPSTLVGGGAGDVLFAQGAGNDLLAAGGDNATLDGGSATGSNVYFGGSGHNLIAAGQGTDTLVGGSGQSTIFAASGDDLVFGADGGGIIAAGTGNSTLIGGHGAELYAFVDGRAGGDVTIYNYRPGIDHVTLPGYAEPSVAASLESQTYVAGSAHLVLSDGTRITFVGVAKLTAGDVV